jgi:polyisoprenoid-binding protein YceI
MANYLSLLTASAVLFAGACSAAETPAPGPAPARPASPAPAAPGGAGVSAAPAGTGGDAAHYTRAAGGGTLTFSFMQAGAENHGSFRQFTTELTYDDKNPTAGKLKVTVQTASLETQDKDRNDTLAGADLLDVEKHPTATYVATSFAKTAAGKLEAVGKLTLRGVTKDLRLPLAIRTTASGAELSGEVTLKRLDYGVGQGDWQSTEGVGNEVKLQYLVPLVRAK